MTLLYVIAGAVLGLWVSWHWYDVLDNEWDKD